MRIFDAQGIHNPGSSSNSRTDDGAAKAKTMQQDAELSLLKASSHDEGFQLLEFVQRSLRETR